MRQRCNKFLVVPGASFAQHGHIDQSTDVPVPQRQGRVHLRGRERLRLIDQRRHPLHEIATFGADVVGIEGADANVENLEDTLSNRDKNNEIALARSIRQHEGDIKRVDADIAEIRALITQHPGTCAGFAPRTTYETPRATFFKPEE